MKTPILTAGQKRELLGDDYEDSPNVYEVFTTERTTPDPNKPIGAVCSGDDDEPLCEVCDGSLVYPVINKFGETLYLMTCPECGDGS